jgi:hypothetical protein
MPINNKYNDFVNNEVSDPKLKNLLLRSSEHIKYSEHITWNTKQKIKNLLIEDKNYWEIDLTIRVINSRNSENKDNTINELKSFANYLQEYKNNWIEQEVTIDAFKSNIDRILDGIFVLLNNYWLGLSYEDLRSICDSLEVIKNNFIRITVYFLSDLMQIYEDINIFIDDTKKMINRNLLL